MRHIRIPYLELSWLINSAWYHHIVADSAPSPQSLNVHANVVVVHRGLPWGPLFHAASSPDGGGPQHRLGTPSPNWVLKLYYISPLGTPLPVDRMQLVYIQMFTAGDPTFKADFSSLPASVFKRSCNSAMTCDSDIRGAGSCVYWRNTGTHQRIIKGSQIPALPHSSRFHVIIAPLVVIDSWAIHHPRSVTANPED